MSVVAAQMTGVVAILNTPSTVGCQSIAVNPSLDRNRVEEKARSKNVVACCRRGASRLLAPVCSS